MIIRILTVNGNHTIKLNKENRFYDLMKGLITWRRKKKKK